MHNTGISSIKERNFLHMDKFSAASTVGVSGCVIIPIILSVPGYEGEAFHHGIARGHGSGRGVVHGQRRVQNIILRQLRKKRNRKQLTNKIAPWVDTDYPFQQGGPLNQCWGSGSGSVRSVPYVFGSPGSASGSVSHKYEPGSGSGSFHH